MPALVTTPSLRAVTALCLRGKLMVARPLFLTLRAQCPRERYLNLQPFISGHVRPLANAERKRRKGAPKQPNVGFPGTHCKLRFFNGQLFRRSSEVSSPFSLPSVSRLPRNHTEIVAGKAPVSGRFHTGIFAITQGLSDRFYLQKKGNLRSFLFAVVNRIRRVN